MTKKQVKARKTARRETAQPKTAKQVLRIIDQALAGGLWSRDLWAVLSALRGPDVPPWGRKNTYTVPIRALAFPKTARGLGQLFSIHPTDPVDIPKLLQASSQEDSSVWVGAAHYLGHVRLALSALQRILG